MVYDVNMNMSRYNERRFLLSSEFSTAKVLSPMIHSYLLTFKDSYNEVCSYYFRKPLISEVEINTEGGYNIIRKYTFNEAKRIMKMEEL